MASEKATSDGQRRKGLLGRIGQLLVKILAFFVILEPIWMLLPFAGFLYGAGLRIQTLARHPETAWLTHFVFPVLTLGLTGPVLVVVGFGIFLVGAGQIYWAKLRRTGMVKNGLYRYVRHPQYTALTFFGLGLLLAWGRAIMFLAFFLMMYLYYYLAGHEEAKCIELFGDEYKEHRERTSLCIPGDRVLTRLWAKCPSLPLPRALRAVVSFALTFLVAFGLLWLISAVRTRVRTVPFMTATVEFAAAKAKGAAEPEMREGRFAGVPYVVADSKRILVVRGPWRNADAAGFAENVLCGLLRMPAFDEFLGFLDEPSPDVAIVFCAPITPPEDGPAPGKRYLPKDSLRRGPEPDPDGPDRVRLIVMRCRPREGATIIECLDPQFRPEALKACMAWVDLSRVGETRDYARMLVEEPRPMGRGPLARKRAEDRWDYLMARLHEREALRQKPQEIAPRPVPTRATSTDLILVQAPILRTRIQPEAWFGGHGHAHGGGHGVEHGHENHFAREIIDLLAASPSFRKRLEAFRAGGERVPVAFPRPGPNWYRQYHVHYEPTGDGRWERHGGTPQISVFVMLVRREPGLDNEALFDESRRGEREILGAFIAELDFGIEAPDDPVHEIVIIGPRRDLEERWDFFLSGL